MMVLINRNMKHETILIRIHSEVKQYANQLCHVKTQIAGVTNFLYRLNNFLSTVTKTIYMSSYMQSRQMKYMTVYDRMTRRQCLLYKQPIGQTWNANKPHIVFENRSRVTHFLYLGDWLTMHHSITFLSPA
jgi:hypothetical protein